MTDSKKRFQNRLLRACLEPIIAILIYLVVFFVFRQTSQNHIPVLQQGSISAGIAIAVYLLYMLNKHRKIGREFKDLQILVTTSVLLASLFTIFSVTGVATIDRSMSVYLLTTIKESGFRDNSNSREDLFREWAGLSDQVGQRIYEQMRLGTIKNINGTLCLTTRGVIVAQSYQTLGKLFKLNQSILSGMNSDEETSINSSCVARD